MTDESWEFADRMFAEPHDHGIAEPDRAVSSVPFGTEVYLTGQKGEGRTWFEGGGSMHDRPVQNITIYPPTRGVQKQGDPFEPVKIGIVIDMDLNQLLPDWIDPTILAIEDALNEGVWARSPIQLVIADARERCAPIGSTSAGYARSGSAGNPDPRGVTTPTSSATPPSSSA